MINNKILSIFVTIMGLVTFFNFTNVYATNNTSDFSSYTTLRDVDKGTFNEYRFLMIKEYFKLKEIYQVKGVIDRDVLINIATHAKKGYNYLPDSLINQNYYNNFVIALKKGLDTPNSEVYYKEIEKQMNNYIEKVNISGIKGSIETIPASGNAPLNVTFRATAADPFGSIIPANNYTWWIDIAGNKKIIGKGSSLNYTFTEMGTFTVFLDVRSSHVNKAGFTDALPLYTRSVINVKEKVATLILSINSINLKDDVIKFTPDESSYGLIFDATSSNPTGGAKFTTTEWDFGNGVTTKYDGAPKVHRVIYSREGDYTAKMKLTTNEGRTVEKIFTVSIYDPIATIISNKEDGYIGDAFTFSARSSTNEKNLTFSWSIKDIENNNKEIFKKEGSNIGYSFSNKGKFNVQLKVKDAAGNEDGDSKIIYINSRAPVAEFDSSIPDPSKPNRILLDGSRSFDPDFSDDGKLKYIWNIDGNVTTLDNIDTKGAIGYYTFDSIGDHNISLEVIDPDQMNSIKNGKIRINSTMSVELFAYPRVIQRGGTIRFISSAPGARFYDWDFGDGYPKSGDQDRVQFNYQKAGTYQVKLQVKDIEGNVNSTSKTVYVGDSSSPVAAISIDLGNNELPILDPSLCENGAYKINRVSNVIFKGGESIDVNGQNNGLTYSWKIGNKYFTSQDITRKFDETGCFQVKLTVKSNKTGAVDSREIWVKVENLKPSLNSLDVAVKDTKTDPVVIGVTALGAQDPDGVIQSYLWYYYTDTDSDPQDFRITNIPSTTFVLPKITGNYYFVVIMKDNNDERFSSEELTSNKYSISLSGDNINTPLIDFSVNKNNILIGEEIIFSTKVKNVLGQDIADKSEYAWDFDGDGFYDQESKNGTITYKFDKSGTYYSKVRVKYKGMTNVRNIEMVVTNKLEPTFEFVSIGNEVIFINTSKGKFDKVVWDLGDGNKVDDKSVFTHIYEDEKTNHNVSLKISEGTKTKTISKEITTDMRTKLSLDNNSGLSYLTYPSSINDEIKINELGDKLVVFLSKNSQVKNYGVDFDIDVDSDLNGTKDDDIDNKGVLSYTDGGMIEITLNNLKEQTFRLYYLDNNGKTIESKDIKVSKNYIKEESIKMETIVFEGISDEEKVKIEKLKSYVQALPQEHRLKGMKFVQQLQEEWFYDTEKTKVILDFESYIDTLKLPNGSDIIGLLESFLVKGQEEKSVSNMSYNVVKNLIPKELVDYKQIVEKLDIIKSNPAKVEDNKKIGSEILKSLETTSLITNEDKKTIKAQLQVLIYGSLDKIPTTVTNEVKEEPSEGFGKIGSLFSGVISGLIWVVLIIVIIIFLFFIWFKISNKNQNQGLQDFIIEKTNLDKDNKPPVVENKITREVKPEIKNDSKTTPPAKTETLEKAPSWLNNNNKVSEDNSKKEDNFIKKESFNKPTEEKKEIIEQIEPKKDSKVPDWLSGAINNVPETKENKKEIVEQIEPENNSKVPDWLSGAINDVPETKENKKEIVEQIEPQNNSKVPDWLSGAINDVPETKENKKEIVEQVEPQNNSKVPDWLSGAINDVSETKEIKKEVVEQIEEENNSKIPDWLNGEINDVSENIDDKKETVEPNIPDWLKGTVDSDLEESSKEKKSIKPKKDTKKSSLDENDTEDSTKEKKSTKPKKTSTKDDKNQKSESNPEDDFWKLKVDEDK